MAQSITPLAAFDVMADGRAVPLSEPWPGPEPADGAHWRWLHLDLTDPALAGWARAHLPPIAASALLQAETRPRCDTLGDGLIVNLRGVNMNPGQDTDDMVSLRLWVSGRLVVTARLRKVFAVDELRAEAAAGRAPHAPEAFLDQLATGLTDRLERVSIDLEEATDALEEAIFERGEADAEALFTTRRKVIRLRRYVGPQREALARLSRQDIPLVGPAVRNRLAETANRVTRIIEELDSVAARLASLQEHINAQNAARIGRNGYVLSVVAAIFLPLGFLTGLFGVNVGGMPGIDSPLAFPLLTLATIGLGALVFVLLRWLKWF